MKGWSLKCKSCQMVLPANRDILVQYYTPWLSDAGGPLLMLDYVVYVAFECSEDRIANVEWFY